VVGFHTGWFQIADQFTEKISLVEYDTFLTKIVGRLYPAPAAAAAFEEAEAVESEATVLERARREAEDDRLAEAAELERLRAEERERAAALERNANRKATSLQALFRAWKAKDVLAQKRLERELMRRSLPTCDLGELDLTIGEDACADPASFFCRLFYVEVEEPIPEAAAAPEVVEVAAPAEAGCAAADVAEVVAEAVEVGDGDELARARNPTAGFVRTPLNSFENLVPPSH